MKDSLLGKEMVGKTCVITGATNGIGLATAHELAARGATLVLHGRSEEKGAKAVEQIVQATGNRNVSFVRANFSSLQDVRRLAGELNAKLPKIDVLLNNAGVVNSKRILTTDGYEATFAVNHLAPFLLTHLLLDKIKASAPARIVNVASTAHRFGKLDLGDLMHEKRYSTFSVYGESKLANILFTRSLAKRLQGTRVTVNALHPGGVRTGLGQSESALQNLLGNVIRLLLTTPEKGARTSVYLATSPEVEGKSGGYYANCKPASLSAQATNDVLAEQLWEASLKLVGLDSAALSKSA